MNNTRIATFLLPKNLLFLIVVTKNETTIYKCFDCAYPAERQQKLLIYLTVLLIYFQLLIANLRNIFYIFLISLLNSLTCSDIEGISEI